MTHVEKSPVRREVRTSRGEPLFKDGERLVGVCDSCSSGWAVEDNRLATEAEIRAANGEGSDNA